MIYVGAPGCPEKGLPFAFPNLFLAGGITGSEDWQKEMVAKLRNEDVMIFNPRRKNFPIHDPSAAEKQITWERHWLVLADGISFGSPKALPAPSCFTNWADGRRA